MTVSPGMSFIHPELKPEPGPGTPEGAGSPPAPAAPTEPEPQPTPQQPAGEPGSPPAPEGQGLIFGKYRSIEDAQKGYFDTVHAYMQEHQARLEAERRAQQVNPVRPEPPAPAAPDPFMEALEEAGIPVQALTSYVQRTAREAAIPAAQEQVMPIVAGSQARAVAARTLPNFDNRENLVADFIQGTPELDIRYRRMFQADPLGAMEWAFAQYDRFNPPGPMPPTPPTLPRQAPSSPSPAALPAPSAPGRSVPKQSEEELERAREYARIFGDPTQFLRLRLKNIHPEIG